jgi:hypothetical protein
VTKFYIKSGDLEEICNKKTPKDAAISAFNTMKDKFIGKLAKLTVVSQNGFDENNDENVYFCTCNLLEETGQLNNFKSADWA